MQFGFKARYLFYIFLVSFVQGLATKSYLLFGAAVLFVYVVSLYYAICVFVYFSHLLLWYGGTRTEKITINISYLIQRNVWRFFFVWMPVVKMCINSTFFSQFSLCLFVLYWTRGVMQNQYQSSISTYHGEKLTILNQLRILQERNAIKIILYK